MEPDSTTPSNLHRSESADTVTLDEMVMCELCSATAETAPEIDFFRSQVQNCTEQLVVIYSTIFIICRNCHLTTAHLHCFLGEQVTELEAVLAVIEQPDFTCERCLSAQE
jgi:hypothetical protein